MPEKINHPFAEHLAQSIRYRFTAAMDALDALERELKTVERGDFAGVIPPEILSAYLYSADEKPLSVPFSGPVLLEQAGRDIGRLLADVTDAHGLQSEVAA